jgi:hypothetical protein
VLLNCLFLSLFILAIFRYTAIHLFMTEANVGTLWSCKKKITYPFLTTFHKRILVCVCVCVCVCSHPEALPLTSRCIYTLEGLRTSIHHHHWLKFPTLKGDPLYSYKTCLRLSISRPTHCISQSRYVISMFQPKETLIWQTAHPSPTLE